jgi:hypothetical protein
MTSDDNSVEQKYKVTPPCPRIGCMDEGIYPLHIILIDKMALFCAKHKEEMEVCGLVTPVTGTSNSGEL